MSLFVRAIDEFSTIYLCVFSTNERKFKMYEPMDLCPSQSHVTGRDASAEAVKDYLFNMDMDKIRGSAGSSPSETINKRKAKRFLANIEALEDDGKYEATLNFFGSSSIEFHYTGEIDGETGLMEGYAMLTVLPKLDCVRSVCSLPEIDYIFGHFVEGVLKVHLKSKLSLNETLKFRFYLLGSRVCRGKRCFVYICFLSSRRWNSSWYCVPGRSHRIVPL
jgi:hypothetical protein